MFEVTGLLNKNVALPRFIQLYEILKSEIIAGKYACFSPIPSQQQLLDAYQVSLITVRRAIEKLSAEGYIERQHGRGCYVAPETNWLSNREKILQVGVIVSSIHSSFFPEIIGGMEHFLHSLNAQLTIAHSQWQAELEKCHIARFLEHGCSGLVISPSQDCEAYQQLQRNGIRFVLFNHYFPDSGFPYVVTDDLNGTRMAIADLIAKGHRKIGAVIGGIGKATALDRLAGFKKGFAEANLDFDENWISWQQNFTYQEGAEGARDLLAKEPGLTAVFCSSEVLATGAAGFLLNQAYRIPEDLSLVAFGDTDITKYYRVPLTTVAQPTVQMGETAAKLLVDKIQGKQIKQDQIKLPCNLVIRDSTAAVGGRIADISDF
jgi:DNA-binding LacI/PurR family transcriptional regulator